LIVTGIAEPCSIIVKRFGARHLEHGYGRLVRGGKSLTKTGRRGGRALAGALVAFWVVSVISGCTVERRKSDAELGLNPQQAAGRKIYDSNCARCHEPYSTRGKKGPGLKGVFQKKYLSLSGLPANDERVSDIVRLGRNEMPGYSQTLSTQDIQDLLAYLHTL
jgi:mono/diheme cytochrome c family protein